MLFHGIDKKLKLTIGSYCDLLEICPDGDINRLSELFDESNQIQMINNIKKMAVILNKGYEDFMAYEDSSYNRKPITQADLNSLSVVQLSAVAQEIQTAITEGMKTEVEAESANISKKN